jgi:hypothetical protein
MVVAEEVGTLGELFEADFPAEGPSVVAAFEADITEVAVTFMEAVTGARASTLGSAAGAIPIIRIIRPIRVTGTIRITTATILTRMEVRIPRRQ